MKPLDEILRMGDPSGYLYKYAYKNGRLESKWEGLLLLLGNPRQLFYYTIYIIEDRWFEAEEHIKKDPRYAYHYAEYIIKKRWEEAEEYIKRDKRWWERYCNSFGVNCEIT